MNHATGQVQKHFQMHSIYKRGKQYYDIEKLKSEEHLEEIIRRKPTRSIETLDTRVDVSFQNSIEAANQKLNHEISSFKRRYQDGQSIEGYDEYLNSSLNETELSGSKVTSRNDRIRGHDWNKMLPRLSQWQKKSPYKNQSQFNNFNVTSKSPPQKKDNSVNFKLATTREYANKTKSPRYHNPETDSIKTGRIKEETVFNRSAYNCLIDYHKSNKRHQRRKQAQALSPIDVSQQKLERQYKNSIVNRSPIMNQFYMKTGKQVPGQSHMRYNNGQTFYFLKKQEREEDFNTKKRRDEMSLKRIKSIKAKKQVPLVREEVCDKKYFFKLNSKGLSEDLRNTQR